jgi:hypothetical protein
MRPVVCMFPKLGTDQEPCKVCGWRCGSTAATTVAGVHLDTTRSVQGAGRQAILEVSTCSYSWTSILGNVQHEDI